MSGNVNKIYLPKSGKSLFELTRVQFAIAVKVHASEDKLKRADSDSTFLLNEKFKLEVQLPDHYVLVYSVESHALIELID